MLVIAAAGRGDIEQAAGDIGMIDVAGIFILSLVQAALAAAIAQCLPFLLGQRLDRQCPETVPHLTSLARSSATAAGPLAMPRSTGSEAMGSPLRPIR